MLEIYSICKNFSYSSLPLLRGLKFAQNVKPRLKRSSCVAISLGLSLISSNALSDTQIPLPSYIYTGFGFARGYWFTSPTNFVITGAQVLGAGGTQYVEIVSLPSAPPTWQTTTTNFSVLYYGNAAAGTIIPLNISVSTGQVIGVLGQYNGNGSDYGSSPYTSSINGNSVVLTRFITQQYLTTPAVAVSQDTYPFMALIALYYSPSVNLSGLNIDVSQASNTSTSTNTAANLSGAVTVNVANGSAAYLPNRKMTIVSSTGLSGTFSGVTTSQNLSFLTPTLSYDANNVYLAYSLTPFSTVAKNINQRNVGNALTFAALGPVNGLSAPILNSLYYGNYENAQAVMDTVGGSGLAGVQSAAMQVGEMTSSSVSDQIAFWRSGETIDATGVTSQEGNNPRNFLAYAPIETKVPAKGPINLKGPAGSLTAAVAPRTFRAWGSMFGGGANYLSDAGRGAAASNVGFYGGLLGVDYQIQPNLLVGVALGGSNANFNVGSLSTNGNLTGFHAGVYGAYTMGNSYLAINETFSAYTNQTNRKAGGYALLPYEQLAAQFGSTEFRTRAEAGHGVMMGGLKATPFIAAEVAAYQSNAFRENSSTYISSFALQNNGQVINSLPTFAGLRLSNAVTLANGWRLAPVGSVAYVHEFFPQRQFTNMLISMPGTDFNVSGPRSTYNLVQTKMGVQLNLNQKLAMFTDFQGEFSPVSQSYAGKIGAKYVW